MNRASGETWRSALVLGLGASGEAAARLLAAKGAEVWAVDGAEPGEADAATALRREGVRVETGVRDLPRRDFDVAVVSPGISGGHPWLAALEARAVPVISELELGWRCRGSRILAVTGSNGKSTLVKLCREALESAGVSAEAGGNYGVPLSAFALRATAPEWIVAEVSSFQLERVAQFAPEVAVLLNLNPNHLDRHGDFAAYAAAKARLFSNLSSGAAVIPEDVPAQVKAAIPATADVRLFGVSPAAPWRYANGEVVCPDGRLPFQGTAFDNDVMGLTAAAAAAAIHGCGLPPACVAKAARAFRPLPHRMEVVTVRRGITVIDDSKATNLAAMEAGILMAPGPVRLIAGGLLKEHDLNRVKKILVKKVRGVYIIGKSSDLMLSAWQDVCKCFDCGTLNAAVERAWRDAAEGEVVLLSPGCASFDQFEGFEDRGNQFRQFVERVTKGEPL